MFDDTPLVLVYDRPNKNLYVLWRTEGLIGDVDGNLNPDNSVCVPAVSMPRHLLGGSCVTSSDCLSPGQCRGMPGSAICASPQPAQAPCSTDYAQQQSCQNHVL